MVDAIADTIIWLARERMVGEPFQNLNAAIHAVMMDVKQPVMIAMSENDRRET